MVLDYFSLKHTLVYLELYKLLTLLVMNNCVDHLFLSKGQPTSARKNILFDHVVCTRLEISLDYIRTESSLQARKKTHKKTRVVKAQ